MNSSESTENIIPTSDTNSCKKLPKFVPVVSLIVYIVDLLLDFAIASWYLYQNRLGEGITTIFFIFVPNLGYLVVSIYAKKDAQLCDCSNRWIRSIIQALYQAVIFIPNAIRTNVRAITRTETTTENQAKNIVLDRIELLEHDAYRFRFLDTRTRATLQSFFQTYFIISDVLHGRIYSPTAETFRIFSVVTSCVNISWSIGTYGGCAPEVVMVTIDGCNKIYFKPLLMSQLTIAEKLVIFFGYVFVLSCTILAISLCIYGEHYILFGVIFLIRNVIRLVRNYKCKFIQNAENSQRTCKSITNQILMILDAELILPNKEFHFTHSLYTPVFFVQLTINSIFLYVWWLGSKDVIIFYTYLFVVGHYVLYTCGFVCIMIFYCRRHFREKHKIVETGTIPL